MTKEEWRGDTLANTLATDPDFVGKKFIVIDGHSHSEYANGEKYGSNVIYGQTKGTLETFGQITIDLSNFEASEAKTIKMREQYALTETMKAYTTDPTIVAKLKDINDAFELVTSKVVLPNLMVDLNGERADVRTGETNLGNLISDSMFEYATNTFSVKPDLAVMNGGGIRASIKPGSVSIKEIITTMPYGNRVVQIDVLGSDIYKMFEHGLKAPIAFDPEGNMLFDENGQPKLSQDPSILHVSDTVKLKFDPRRAAVDRITSLEILDQDTQQFEIVDLNRTYKLVTLEFLAVGGDGFTMLSGARQEGKTDSDIFADHFELNTIDWTKYAQDAPKRVAPLSFANLDVTKTYLASLKSANTALTNTKFTKASRDVLAVVLAEYEAITNKVKGVGDDKLVINAEYSTALVAINEAVSNLVKEVEKPVEPSDTNESATDRPDVNTGIYQDYPLFGLGLSIISLAGYVHLRKRKMTAEN